MEGWIKLHRKIADSKFGKNPELFHLFVNLLIMANHKDGFTEDGTLVKAGQLMTSRDALARKFNAHPSKMYRMLSNLADAKQIEQQPSTKNTIISILNWSEYQGDEQRVNNGRTASEQRVNTNKNAKNNKNEKNTNTPGLFEVEPLQLETDIQASHEAVAILTMLNTICFRAFRPTEFNLKFINARLKEKYSIEDFKKVIDYKNKEWSAKPEMKEYLQPSTLFGNKFDQYLNQALGSETISQAEEDALIAKFFPGA